MDGPLIYLFILAEVLRHPWSVDVGTFYPFETCPFERETWDWIYEYVRDFSGRTYHANWLGLLLKAWS